MLCLHLVYSRITTKKSNNKSTGLIIINSRISCRISGESSRRYFHAIIIINLMFRLNGFSFCAVRNGGKSFVFFALAFMSVCVVHSLHFALFIINRRYSLIIYLSCAADFAIYNVWVRLHDDYFLRTISIRLIISFIYLKTFISSANL